MSEPAAWHQAFAAAGAALRATRTPKTGELEYAVVDGKLVLTGMLADKVLGMIEAGEKLPPEIDLSGRDMAALIRYLTVIVTHWGPEHPLVADHPAFNPIPPDLPLTPYHGGWP